MTTLDQRSTIEDVLAAVNGLTPGIANRAPEIEKARRIPGDLLEKLVDAGVFRMSLPTSHGGLGADLPGAMRVLETLARADASVGWTVAIGGIAWCDLVGLPRATFDELYDADSVITAGVFSPSGSIKAVDGGYRVSGRWSFASGVEHATWIYGNCVEGMVEGHPSMRIAVFSPDEVTIEDTWNVTGLSGTGSHHFSVDDVFVPSERTVVPLEDEPSIDEAMARIPVPALVALSLAAVAVGIARGALDDVTALAREKTPLLADSHLAANPHFQYRLAEADTGVRAARGLLHDTANMVWETAEERQQPTWENRAHIRAAAAWATERSADAVTTAYRFGGGNSIYVTSPLQRRLRDINAVTQHFLLRPDTLTTAGAILAGQDVEVPVF